MFQSASTSLSKEATSNSNQVSSRIPITDDERNHGKGSYHETGKIYTLYLSYTEKILWDNCLLGEKLVALNGYCVLEKVCL